MIRFRWCGLIVAVVVLAAVLAVTGCGGSDSAIEVPPRELTEEQKKQLREYEQQRQEEWGTKKKR
ncbi:MAG TPA: hypothetical protein VNK04_12380 [Gemmataceae bacterium]|nr:hypothetical protein [Gemmataceae bacterium]